MADFSRINVDQGFFNYNGVLPGLKTYVLGNYKRQGEFKNLNHCYTLYKQKFQAIYSC